MLVCWDKGCQCGVVEEMWRAGRSLTAKHFLGKLAALAKFPKSKLGKTKRRRKLRQNEVLDP